MVGPRETSIRAANVSDQAASQDSLGFEPYVAAIAEFLTNPETEPPLTLSVEGPWGSGKSSFMQQLQQAIEQRTQEQIRDRLRQKREKCFSNIQKPGGDLRESVEKELEKLAQNTLINSYKSTKLISRISSTETVNNKRKETIDGERKKKLLARLKKRQKKVFKDLPNNLLRLLTLVGINLVLFPVLFLLTSIYILVNIAKILWLSFRIRLIRKPKVIWFNAWRHEKAEALWAAFALAFLEEISKPRHWIEILAPVGGHLKLFLSRFEWSVASFCDLGRKGLQLVLLTSATALLIIFAFFKGYNWTDRLATNLNNIADNLGRPPEKMEAVQADLGNGVNQAISQFCSDQQGDQQYEFCKPVGKPEGQAIEASKPESSSEQASSSGEKKDKGKSEAEAKGKDQSDSSIPWQKWPFIGTLLGSGGLATLWLLQQLQKVIGSPKKELTEYLKSPNYDSQVSFIEKFHADFKKIVDAYAGKGNKVYVFIDDLDRCEVPKSADLMQAINLMIANDPQLVFILGMDREKVAAGLAVKHQPVIPYLSSAKLNAPRQEGQEQDRDLTLQGIEYGYAFIEKFVQLPFLLPQPSQADFELFMDRLAPAPQSEESFWQSIWAVCFRPIETYWNWLIKSERSTGTVPTGEQTSQDSNGTGEESSSSIQERFRSIKIKTGADSEEVRDILTMVAPILDWNPRRLKRFLNLFRLRAFIADATGLFYDTDSSDPADRAITLEQLGKFTAIGLQYPLLLIELERNPSLLEKLQKYALQNSGDDSGGNHKNAPQLSQSLQSPPTLGDLGGLNPWIDQPQLLKLLCYGCIAKDPDFPAHLREKLAQGKIKCSDYSFENVEVGKLLRIAPRVHPVDRIDLVSEKGVDYSKLRNLLKAQKWREADQETYQVMLKAAGREAEGYLDIPDIQDFPCKDLQTIDQLWVAASRGRFGFSVQKQIWQKCGSPGVYNRAWEKFGVRVGWRKAGNWLPYDSLQFDLRKSLPGELPRCGGLNKREQYGSFLAQRLANCNIQ